MRGVIKCVIYVNKSVTVKSFFGIVIDIYMNKKAVQTGTLLMLDSPTGQEFNAFKP